jgi:hypothetical protein
MLKPVSFLVLTTLTTGYGPISKHSRAPAADFDLDLTFRKLSKYASNLRAPSSDAPKSLEVQMGLIEAAIVDLALRQVLSSSPFMSVGCRLAQRSDLSCVVGLSVDFD